MSLEFQTIKSDQTTDFNQPIPMNVEGAKSIDIRNVSTTTIWVGNENRVVLNTSSIPMNFILLEKQAVMSFQIPLNQELIYFFFPVSGGGVVSVSFIK